MAKKKGAGSTPATLALTRLGIRFTLHEFEHDPAQTDFGGEAAERLDVSERRIFKTLLAQVDGELVVGIVPVAGKLDLKALAAAVGGKRAAMADPLVAERKTGYVIGGISPIGQRTRLRAVLDHSVQGFDTVFVSGGRRGLDIELAPDALIDATDAVLAAIARAA